MTTTHRCIGALMLIFLIVLVSSLMSISYGAAAASLTTSTPIPFLTDLLGLIAIVAWLFFYLPTAVSLARGQKHASRGESMAAVVLYLSAVWLIMGRFPYALEVTSFLQGSVLITLWGIPLLSLLHVLLPPQPMQAAGN